MISRRSHPIVVIQTGDPVPEVRAHRGSFAQLIQDATGPHWRGGWDVVDVRSSPPPDVRGASAFVITGSASNVPNREPWVLRVEAWLREVVAAGTPTLGICFGHQLLGQALGGEVIKNPLGREMGTLVVHADGAPGDPVLDGLPSRFTANLTHIDSVQRRPPAADVLARSELDPHQVLRFSATCYGVQFHPEIDADVMRGYIASRRAILEQEGFDVDRMLSDVDDAPMGRMALQNFVRHLVT